MEGPSTVSEVLRVMQGMETSQAPGLDGFVLLYYRMFSTLLLLHLVHPCNALLNGVRLPKACLNNHITLILNRGKDRSDCANYFPISLLNIDL